MVNECSSKIYLPITVGSLATVAEELACSVAAIAQNCGYRLPFFRND
jgi:hypothetical protein